MHATQLYLPRSAFTPREAARAGDLWRVFQDVAVAGSIDAGWTPERYREEGVSMAVRSMTVRHVRETLYGERLTGRTWPSQARRQMFFRRECRLETPDGPVASATQEWIHVRTASGEKGPTVALARASEALVEAFTPETHDPSVELPELVAPEPVGSESAEEGWHRLELDCWQTWVDPLGHVNHPAYVDFCDEALSRVMVARGLDPVALQPVAERVVFKSGVRAGERVTVRSRLRGATADGSAVFEQVVEVGERCCARATAVRRLFGEQGRSALLALVT